MKMYREDIVLLLNGVVVLVLLLIVFFLFLSEFKPRTGVQDPKGYTHQIYAPQCRLVGRHGLIRVTEKEDDYTLYNGVGYRCQDGNIICVPVEDYHKEDKTYRR